MKLQLVPAKRGAVWVRRGIGAFFRQPMAMLGLFALFIAAMVLIKVLPYVGKTLMLVAMPGATLGLMSATRESARGQFPMPSVLVQAFRVGRERLRAMLQLGGLYAAGFLAILAVTALFDGGSFAQFYFKGGKLSEEVITSSGFQRAVWANMLLNVPLAMLFWHAPGLVHWHGVPPLKSLFFSGVACLRNMGAYTVFTLTWMAVFLLAGLVMSMVAAAMSMADAVTFVFMPMLIVVGAMFFTSIYFTFEDSFVTSDGEPTTALETASP